MLDTICCSFPVVIPWDKLKGWGKKTYLNQYKNYLYKHYNGIQFKYYYNQYKNKMPCPRLRMDFSASTMQQGLNVIAYDFGKSHILVKELERTLFEVVGRPISLEEITCFSRIDINRDKKCKKEVNMENLTLKQAVLIGASQVLAALIPGFSRSGTTMTVARATKMERESAAKFSFLLGAPAIAGAALLAFVQDFSLAMLNLPFILAVLVSFLVGMIAIKTLMEVVKKIGYEIFAIYRVLLGAALIIVYLVRL